MQYSLEDLCADVVPSSWHVDSFIHSQQLCWLLKNLLEDLPLMKFIDIRKTQDKLLSRCLEHSSLDQPLEVSPTF